jgi:hypothetical protein
LGCRVEVVAFGKSTSGKLKEAADNFIDLDRAQRKFLMAAKVMPPPARRPAVGARPVAGSRPAVGAKPVHKDPGEEKADDEYWESVENAGTD